MKFLFFNLAVAAALGYLIFVRQPAAPGAPSPQEAAVAEEAAPEAREPFLPEISAAIEKLGLARQEDAEQRLAGIEQMLASLQDSNARLAALMENAGKAGTVAMQEAVAMPVAEVPAEAPVIAAPVAAISSAEAVPARPVEAVFTPAIPQAPVAPEIAALLEDPSSPPAAPQMLVPQPTEWVDAESLVLPEDDEKSAFMSARDRQRELGALAEDMETLYVSKLGE